MKNKLIKQDIELSEEDYQELNFSDEELDEYYREMAEPDPDEFKSEYEDNKFIGYE